MTFLIEVIKALIIFIAVCAGLAMLYIVFIIAREVGWMIKQENRKQYAEKKEGDNT